MLLAGLLLLGVGLLEAGRLFGIFQTGHAAGYSRTESPKLHRINVAVLAIGVLALVGGGGFLVLLVLPGFTFFQSTF